MSFPIAIGVNTSEENAVTKNFTVFSELVGTLRAGSSIVNPVIQVEWTHGDISTISLCNYLYVPSFSRYYFIKDITSDYDGLVTLNCHVDVLMSFANQIKSNKGIIHRQEARYNLYLNDGVLKCYQNPVTATIPFPNDLFGVRTNVLLVAGGRRGGASYGVDAGGAGGTYMKNTAGLIEYAYAQLGKPYWYGTFGNTASAQLYNQKKAQYGSLGYYTETDYDQQYGERVHDCVGLIKGYRWSETPTSDPRDHYEVSEDVDVKGMWYSCAINSGTITPEIVTYPLGMIVFNSDLTHCGVYVGAGKVVEARSHAYGVVESNMSDRGFLYWGIPDWLQLTTGVG